MAVGSNRDVELVIKARDDASKSLEAINKTLDAFTKLQEAATKSGTQLGVGFDATANKAEQFELKLQGLKELETVAASLKKVEAAVETMGRQIAASANGITSTKNEIEALKNSLPNLDENFKKAVASVNQFVAPLERLKTEIAAAKKSMAEMEQAGANGKNATEAQKNEYKGQVEALKQLQAARKDLLTQMAAEGLSVSTINKNYRDAENARTAAANGVERLTKSLQGQEKAFESQFSKLVEYKNALRDIKPAADNAAAAFGTVLDKASIAGARGAASQDMAAAQAAAAARAANNQLAERAQIEAAIQRNTGVGQIPATQQGATISALTELVEKEHEAQKASEEAAASAQKAAEQQAATAKKEAEQRATEAQRAAEVEAAAFQRVHDRLNPLDALTRRYNEDLAALRKGMSDADKEAGKLAASEAKLTAEFESHKKAIAGRGNVPADGTPLFMGMRPYELTNLGYQINDVVSGFASGQRPMQIFAQQAGQIIQLMPNLGQKIFAVVTNLRMLAGVSVAGASLFVLAEAFGKVADEAARIRDLDKLKAMLPDTTNFDSTKIAKAAEAMHQFGISSEEAGASFKTFLSAGFAQGDLERLTVTAKGLADATGTDLKTAVQAVSQAFSGGAEKVLEYDKQINFLTVDQRAHVTELMNQGKSVEAVNYAYDIFSRKSAEVEAHLSSAQRLARSLSSAWNEFVNVVAHSAPIQSAADALSNLADKAAKALHVISGEKTREDLQAQLKADQDALTRQEAALADAQQKNRPGWFISGIQGDIDRYRKSIEETKKALDEFNKAHPNGVTNGQGGVAGQRRDYKDMAPAADIERQLGIEAMRRSRQSDDLISPEERKARIDAATAAARKEADALDIPQAEKDKIVGLKVAAEEANIQRESEAIAKARGTAESIAKRIIEDAEGFRSKAYKDSDGRYRVGYGSSTTTDESGRVRTVTASTTTGKEAAERDLERRIKDEFIPAIKREIGGDRYDKFTSQQQAVLTSLIYNYGSLGRTKDGHGAGIEDVLRHGSTQEIGDAIRKLGNDNNGVNRGRRNKEADLFGSPNAAIEADNKAIAEEVAATQGKADRAIKDTLDKQREQTAELTRQNRLQDTALINEQIRYAGEKAVADAVRQRNDENAQRIAEHKQAIADLTAAELDGIRKTAEAEARAQNERNLAQANVTENMRSVNDLTAERDALMSQLEALRANGQNALADALIPQIETVNVRLQEAIEKAIAFWQALTPEQRDLLHMTTAQIDAMVASLKRASAESKNLKTGVISAVEVNKDIASGLTNSILGLAHGFRNAKEAFLNFASSFLHKIAEMILQAQILKLLEGWGIGGKVSGVVNAVAGGVAPSNHTGGIVGASGGVFRPVSAATFHNAMRYHTGGVAGLNADEVPTILQKNEEVLTTADPRHRWNMGAANNNAASPQQDIKIVNAIDTGHMLSEAMNTTHGQRAIVNFIRSNARAVNTALKG